MKTSILVVALAAAFANQLGKAASVFDGSAYVPDPVGHGVHVAGLIAGLTAYGAPFQGAATGANPAVAKAFNVDVVQFGRSFGGDPARSVAPGVPQSSTSALLFSAFERHDALVDEVQPNRSLTYASGGRLAVTQTTSGGLTVGAGSGSMSTRFFGLAASGLAPFALSGEGRFNAPYYAMVQDAKHGGLSFALGQGGRVRVGMLTEGAAANDGPYQSISYPARRSLFSAEYEQRAGRAVGILSIGVLHEKRSLLGSGQSNALALNAVPRTAFASVSAAYSVTPRLAFVGMASVGRSAAFSNADSLVANVSSVGTVAFSAGVSARQVWDKSDRLGLTLSVPTKVTQGEMSLSGAAFQREDGTLSYANRILNLRPTATEQDIEMSYSRQFGNRARLSAAMMLRLHPGHDAASPNDLLLGVRFVSPF